MEIAGVADTVEVRTGDIPDDLDDLSGFDVLTLDTETHRLWSSERLRCWTAAGRSRCTPRSWRTRAKSSQRPPRSASTASKRLTPSSGRWTSTTAAPAHRPVASVTPDTDIRAAALTASVGLLTPWGRGRLHAVCDARRMSDRRRRWRREPRHAARRAFRPPDGRNAEITYDFDDMEVDVPSKAGEDAEHARWRVDGTLTITTRDND